MKKSISFLMLSLFVLLFSCKKDTVSEPTGEVVNATIVGKVVAANMVTPISRAMVFVNTPSNTYITYTNQNGEFQLSVPSGEQELRIQTGSGNHFRTTMNLTIEPNQTLVLNESLRLNQIATFAYLAGNYDKIEAILRDSLGYQATPLYPTDFQNLASLARFDAIFLNCGVTNVLASGITDYLLSQYVALGGSIYASDFSMNFLDGTNNSLPCPIQRDYGFIPDTTVCSKRSGAPSIITGASITSNDLGLFLNKTNIDLEYNLFAWERLQYVDENYWEVMVRDTSNQEALLIRTNKYENPFGGSPNLTIGTTDTSHVTICHQTGLNNQTVTLTVNTNTLQSHLAHGDVVGPCNNPNNSGWVYFTTFHNEHNGRINSDTKKILEYMILNL
jgi:hypothetical protein